MATELGYSPNVATLVLSEGADWVCTLQEENTTWPTGTTCRIEFPELSGVGPYTATVTLATATAVFLLDKADTTADDIPSGSLFRIYLVKGTTADYLWFHGKVKRKEDGK